MTNIEQKALELVNEVLAENGMNNTPFTRLPTAVNNLVLIRAIKQHEAFRQEVSDAVEKTANAVYSDSSLIVRSQMKRFIIAKPDPLVDAVKDILDDDSLDNAEEFSEAIRAALAKRNGRIVFDD